MSYFTTSDVASFAYHYLIQSRHEQDISGKTERGR